MALRPRAERGLELVPLPEHESDGGRRQQQPSEPEQKHRADFVFIGERDVERANDDDDDDEFLVVKVGLSELYKVRCVEPSLKAAPRGRRVHQLLPDSLARLREPQVTVGRA